MERNEESKEGGGKERERKVKRRERRGELELRPRETLRESSPGPIALLMTSGKEPGHWRSWVIGSSSMGLIFIA